MKSRIVFSCWLTLLCPLAAMSADLWIVNPGSERPLVPAVGPAGDLKDGPAPVSINGQAVPADVWAGSLYVLAAVDPLKAVKASVGSGQAKEPMKVAAAADRVKVATDRGEWLIYADGRLSAFPDGVELALQGRSNGTPALVFNGAALTVIESADKSVRHLVFRSGVMELTTKVKTDYTWPAGTAFECSTAENSGFALSYRSDKMADRRDWVRLGGKPGLHIGYVEGEVSAQPERLEKLQGTLRLVPGITDTWASVHTQAALGELIVLNEQLVGGYRGFDGKVSVKDRDNNGPDWAADQWLFDQGGDGKLEMIMSCQNEVGNRAIHVFLPKGKTLDEVKLVTKAGSVDKYAINYLEEEKAKSGAESKTEGLTPAMTLVDWNNDGQFFTGSLLSGGYLQQDKVIYGSNEAEALDLDGDGDIDVAAWTGGAQFDLEDVAIGLMAVNLKPGLDKASVTGINSVRLATIGASWYNKTYNQGRNYKGALIGFEEHINMVVRPGRVPEFPEGANFFFKSSDENIDRMTFGHLSQESGLAWNIELDPAEVDRESPERYKHMVEYKDPWGHEYRVLSIIYPLKWDGKALPWVRHPEWDKALEIFPNCPWYRTTTGKYFPAGGVRMCITPEGFSYGSNEGMYVGALSHHERIEVEEHGTTYVLYYSSLMGGLHMKGADYGHASFPANWPIHARGFWDRLAWYHYMDGVTRKGRYVGYRNVHAPEGKRPEGPIFFTYMDRDRDQFFDTYVLDIDNDGLYEKALWYNAQSKFVELQQGGFRTAWPYQAVIVEAPYQMGNYQKIRDLYRRGFSEDAMIERYQLGSSGVPVERQTFAENALLKTGRPWRPDFYVIFGEEWITKAAMLEEPDMADRFGWKDFSPTGFTRLGTLLTEQGLAQTTLRKLTRASLQGCSILVIGHLSHVLNEEELAALLTWVEEGGLVALAYTAEDETDRLYLNALGAKLGFALGDKMENRTTVMKLGTMGAFTDLDAPYCEERTVTPNNRIEHYQDAAGWGLLKDFKYLSFAGCPLKLEAPMKPVLAYKGQVLMASAEFGKGMVLVAGINALSDWHVRHSDYSEPSTQNDELLQRLAGYLAGRISRFDVETCSYAAGAAAVKVKGRGGPVFLPPLAWSRDVTVNGQPAVMSFSGALARLVLPGGANTIELKPKAKEGAKP